MFELYNEPHDVSWSQWLNGDGTYAGMQEMYNAVRAAGAQSIRIQLTRSSMFSWLDKMLLLLEDSTGPSTSAEWATDMLWLEPISVC